MINFVYYDNRCRSALRIAIRRGDIGLAFSAFSQIWAEDRDWLKFRLPLIVIEEAFYLIGVYDSFLKRVNKLGEEQSYKNFIGILTMCTKSKDVAGLVKLCDKSYRSNEFEYEELVSVRKLWNEAHIGVGVDAVSYHLLNHQAHHKGEPDTYTLDALAVLYEFIKAGGNEFNRKTLMVGMFLVMYRGLDKQLINFEVKKAWNKVPKRVKIFKMFPWYIFHPCSTVAMDEKLWKHCVYEYVDPDMIQDRKLLKSRVLNCFESMWWGYERRKRKTYTKKWKASRTRIRKQMIKILSNKCIEKTPLDNRI